MRRSSGILLHPTALPGPFGIGSLGVDAVRFIDFLTEAGQRTWQILPLGPTGYGHSPYNALSAFAGNPMLIDLERLVDYGDLTAADLRGCRFAEGRVNDQALVRKNKVLEKAGRRFFRKADSSRCNKFLRFCRQHADWLEDYALFMALRDHFEQASWATWPDELRGRQFESLKKWREQLAEEVNLQRYLQFIFFEQWLSLKEHANRNGISILGDIPIFVAYDSSDVWACQDLFQLDESGRPLTVAGVPPDYFSKTGQRWGNPLYDWRTLEEQGFDWWLARFRHNLTFADFVRIDHFRGFESCWSIPADAETAVKGRWEPVPGAKLFDKLQEEFPDLPVIAEDLGVITPEVEKLRRQYGFPGMKILQFAFDSGPDNPYLPENYQPDFVVYTGTHDNNTTLGWWQSLTRTQRRPIADILGKAKPDIPWDLIEMAEESIANLCILPCQDILSLGAEARFNTPGTVDGNWTWRIATGDLTSEVAGRLKHLCDRTGRTT